MKAFENSKEQRRERGTIRLLIEIRVECRAKALYVLNSQAYKFNLRGVVELLAARGTRSVARSCDLAIHKKLS